MGQPHTDSYRMPWLRRRCAVGAPKRARDIDCCQPIESLLLVQLAPEISELPAPVQRFDKATRFAPVLFDDDVQLQKDARAQQRLDLLARGSADCFELRAALADQNCFLPGAFAVDGRGD